MYKLRHPFIARGTRNSSTVDAEERGRPSPPVQPAKKQPHFAGSAAGRGPPVPHWDAAGTGREQPAGGRVESSSPHTSSVRSATRPPAGQGDAPRGIGDRHRQGDRVGCRPGDNPRKSPADTATLRYLSHLPDSFADAMPGHRIPPEAEPVTNPQPAGETANWRRWWQRTRAAGFRAPSIRRSSLCAVLGQQASSAAARTDAAHLVIAHGALEDPMGDLTHLFPDPATLAALDRRPWPYPGRGGRR